MREVLVYADDHADMHSAAASAAAAAAAAAAFNRVSCSQSICAASRAKQLPICSSHKKA
jgi:hypothetical protein